MTYQILVIILIKLDQAIQLLLSTVMQNAEFLALEASWRGIYWLIDEDTLSSVKVRLFNVSKKELLKDFSEAQDLTKSYLYHKVYEEEWEHAGGEPYGLILMDFLISIDHEKELLNDIILLEQSANLAAKIFCPFIFQINLSSLQYLADNIISSQLLSDDFHLILPQVFKLIQQKTFANFIGLCLQPFLIRAPYSQFDEIDNPFVYHENNFHLNNMCWCSSIYFFGKKVIKEYVCFSWFSDVSGYTSTETKEFSQRKIHLIEVFGESKEFSLIPIALDENLIKIFEAYGFIVIIENLELKTIGFNKCPSIYQMQENSSHMMDFFPINEIDKLLCICRFAHYLKIMLRDKIGSWISEYDCQLDLQDWLNQYTADQVNLSEALKSRYPLKYSQVKVVEDKISPGKFHCDVVLIPHFEEKTYKALIKI